jgi:hypothetical protein
LVLVEALADPPFGSSGFGILDGSVLRFQRVGIDGEEGDIAVWENWTEPATIR